MLRVLHGSYWPTDNFGLGNDHENNKQLIMMITMMMMMMMMMMMIKWCRKCLKSIEEMCEKMNLIHKKYQTMHVLFKCLLNNLYAILKCETKSLSCFPYIFTSMLFLLLLTRPMNEVLVPIWPSPVNKL